MNGNGNGGGMLTKTWALGLLVPAILALMVWIGRGWANDLRAEAQTNVTQQRDIDRLKILGEVAADQFKEINRKLDLLLQEVPRR